VRHQDVGDGERVGRDELAAVEPAVRGWRGGACAQADRELAVLAASIRLQSSTMQAQQRQLDRVHRGEAPAHHLRLAGQVARDQRAGLLRQVDQDRRRLGQHHAVVVDRGICSKGLSRR
jgi:hypothetical protein